MNFLTENERFSFTYDGKDFHESLTDKTVTVEGNTVTTRYQLTGGLVITNAATYYPDFGAYEWVNHMENTGDGETGLIENLFDADCVIPFPPTDTYAYTAYGTDPEKDMKVMSPEGAGLKGNEFDCDPDLMIDLSYVNHLYEGSHNAMKMTSVTGRSCDKTAPFLNVHQDGHGVILAIGWTGQWECTLTRTAEGLRVQSGIEALSFRMLPGEKWRTSSIVVMPYESDIADSQNKWRSMVRKHFSLIGKPGRDTEGPLCFNLWGGMSSAGAIERIRKADAAGLPHDYVWMDAGWYGTSDQESPDEFEGDWVNYTGDWQVNPHHHPNGLLDVTKAIHDGGHKFVLWFEPERVWYSCPDYKEHPDYFLTCDEHPFCKGQGLLDLGNEQAWQYIYDLLSEKIETLSIDYYRQDFNTEALPYWRKADTDGRRGVHEIKHINGLYRLWDALLAKFPHLMIDDCCSGGRRIDIELLRRSVPLWRSDLQCPAATPPEFTQQHQLTYALWLPYCGTSTGRKYDTYHARSCYAPALATNYAFSERDAFGDPEKLGWIKKMMEEYKRVRPYFDGDLYALTRPSHDMSTWSALQLNRKAEEDGLILCFRRPKAPYETACFPLRGLEDGADYVFTDADSGETVTVNGAVLKTEGLSLTIPTRRTSRLLFYRKK